MLHAEQLEECLRVIAGCPMRLSIHTLALNNCDAHDGAADALEIAAFLIGA
jgi:hypothetical protein